jgi:hypothetical protein
MILEPEVPDIHKPITPEEATAAAHNDGWFSDDPALRLVVLDCEKAESYATSKSWVMNWNGASTLYQSPEAPRFWPGTQVPAASVPFFTVATAVNSLVPQIISGLFYDDPPFIVQQRPGTTSQTARAIGDVLGYQMEDINFREEIRLGVMNTCLYGTGIWKWGWEKYTKERKLYKRKNPTVTLPSSIPGAPDTQISDDEIEEVIEEEVVDRPTFQHIVNLRQVLVDPSLEVPDIRRAKYVIHRLYMTWKDLDKLRERPGFDIPSKEKLLSLFLPPVEQVDTAPQEDRGKNPLFDARSEARYEDVSANPLEDPLEILERWDNDTYIVVLQKKLVICNDKNPYGKIPFLSVNWWDVPEAFYGLGLSRTIGAEQRLQQGITNLWLDQASLNLNGVYVRLKGQNVPTQNIRIAPGKIIDTDTKDGFKPLERQPAVPEAGQHLEMSQSRAEKVSGANEAATQGFAGSAGHSNLARSSAGAQLIASGSGNRPGDFIEKLSDQVIVPFLYETYEMDRAMLPLSQLRYILDDELEHEFLKDGGDLVDLLNARLRFSILAGAKMQARQNAARALPLLINFVTNQQTQSQLGVQKKKINFEELLRMSFESSGWKNYNDVIQPMSDEEFQRWQQSQPGAQVQAKAQAQQAMEQTKFGQKQQLLDQENTARAARDVLRQKMKDETEQSSLF